MSRLNELLERLLENRAIEAAAIVRPDDVGQRALVRPRISWGEMQPLPGLEAIVARHVEPIDHLVTTLERWERKGDLRTIGKWRDGRYSFWYGGDAITIESCTGVQSWGAMQAIMTSDDALARRFTTHRKRGGFLPDGWTYTQGVLKDEAGELVAADTEEQFFALLDVPYIPPSRRYVGGRR